MNPKEIKAKIQELQNELNQVENDPIRLLDRDEYGKYGNIIPDCRANWWLSSSDNEYMPYWVWANVNYAPEHQDPYFMQAGYRPVIKDEKIIDTNLGERITLCGFPFIKIDKDLAIAEVPICFDIFDDKNINDYASSKVRAFLIDWYYERKDF